MEEVMAQEVVAHEKDGDKQAAEHHSLEVESLAAQYFTLVDQGHGHGKEGESHGSGDEIEAGAADAVIEGEGRQFQGGLVARQEIAVAYFDELGGQRQEGEGPGVRDRGS